METFELEGAACRLVECRIRKKKVKNKDKLEQRNVVKFLVSVDERSRKACEYLFPMHEQVENGVAARSGTHPGLEMKASTDIEKLSIHIEDEAGKTVWDFGGIRPQGKPTLKINRLGDSHLEIGFDPRMSSKDMGKLKDYVEADLYMTAKYTQPELPMKGANGSAEPKEEAPVQENLDGSMPHEDLAGFREKMGMNRGEFVMWFADQGVVVSSKSLGRYERGERVIPDELADVVRAAMVKPEAVEPDSIEPAEGEVVTH